MRTENFYKAQPITQKMPVESVMIIIDETIPEIPRSEGDVLTKSANLFDEQAARLAEALHSSLPQGMFDRLVLEFMRRRVSLYYGIEQIPLDRRLIEWLESKKQTIELCYHEFEGWSIECLLGNVFKDEDGSLRGALMAGHFHDERLTEVKDGKGK